IWKGKPLLSVIVGQFVAAFLCAAVRLANQTEVVETATRAVFVQGLTQWVNM
ncbi:hypothetical protein AAVH_16781, partial [Aphelenchoides avenae]